MRRALFRIRIAFVLVAAGAAFTQTKDLAPIPSPILAAKKIFISNAGQESVPRLGYFTGDADHAYNQFYSAMKTWGQYELVSAPADADLIFEISFTVLPAGNNVFKGDSLGTPYVPRLKLLILDPKTHFTLWGFTEEVDWAILAGNRNKNFSQGMDNLVADLKKLTTRSAPSVASAKP
jgi:hypothetical protein